MNAFDLMRKAAPAASNSNSDLPADDIVLEESVPDPNQQNITSFFGTFTSVPKSNAIDEVAARTQPWIEKYRPQNLSEVSAQDQTVAVLKKTLQSANLPHMLFYGPPGTGKTSTILALCKEMFGPDLYKSRVLELNASDERGISVVREKVKNFARGAVKARPGAPPYKIIILDEADSMTQDAQSALRRIMETYSRITRFCLVCNYVTRIIEPIVSRCSKFRFKSLDQSSALSRLEDICTKEDVAHAPGTLEELIRISDGDLRRAITYLQSAARLYPDEPIPPLAVQEITGVVPTPYVEQLLAALGTDSSPTHFGDVQRAVTTLQREGFSASQVLIHLHEELILNPAVSARAKARIALILGQTDKYLTDGADEELQLLNCCWKVHEALLVV